MEFLKKLFAAIFLSLLISAPIIFLEAFAIYNIITLYQIPYINNFGYYQIVGGCFVIMITRNQIKIRDEENEEKFLPELINLAINRFFRIVFVWSVALVFHEIFLR